MLVQGSFLDAVRQETHRWDWLTMTMRLKVEREADSAIEKPNGPLDRVRGFRPRNVVPLRSTKI